MPESIQEQTIKFSGNRKAIAVTSSVENAATEIQSKLNLSPYKAIILVFGSADNIDDKIKPRLTQLCRRGIASAAADANAVILDGGTKAGIAMLMGTGVASRSTKISLIGVAPQSMVDYDKLKDGVADETSLEPNHSHFVLVQEGSDWGSEMPTLFSLADALIQPQSKPAEAEERGTQSSIKPRMAWRAKSKKEAEKATADKRTPALAVLIGGSQVEKNEVLQAVRRKISLIVVKGSGGLADDVASAFNKTDVLPDDPDLAEIIADGDIHLHLLDDLVDGMKRLIQRELATDKVLQQAWQTFSTYDLNATLHQKWFRHLQMWILCVGLVGTALAISDQVLQTYHVYDDSRKTLLAKFFQYILILIPIAITALVAASNRFKQGSKWMLLRAGAESIKREIYKYRIKGYYKDFDSTSTRTEDELKRQEQATPEQEITQKVENITRRVMRTEVNSTALKQYTGAAYPPDYGQPATDDGFSQLTPDKYVAVRLDEQIKYFQGKAPKLRKTLFTLTCSVLVAGAVGTFLSAAGWPVWIALTTAAAGAFTSYLGYMQVEATLTKYNQAATDLENVKGWWNALSASEQAMTKNIRLLVDHTEDVLQTELDGWVQQMKDALETLRKDQAKDETKPDGKAIEVKPGDNGDNPPPIDQAKVGGDDAAQNKDDGTTANVQAGVDQSTKTAVVTQTPAVQNADANTTAVTGQADAAETTATSPAQTTNDDKAEDGDDNPDDDTDGDEEEAMGSDQPPTDTTPPAKG